MTWKCMQFFKIRISVTGDHYNITTDKDAFNTAPLCQSPSADEWFHFGIAQKSFFLAAVAHTPDEC